MATAPTKLWTIDDLDDLPDGQIEVWRGELVKLPASGSQHSMIAGNILTAINVFARSERLGFVTGEGGGYVLSRDPLMLLIPDVAFVRSSTMAEATPRIPEIAPDLVVEIVSPTDRMSEVREKVDIYLTAGVSVVWVVLPERRLVQVHRADQPGVIREVRDGEELDGGDVLPGFRLALSEIFD